MENSAVIGEVGGVPIDSRLHMSLPRRSPECAQDCLLLEAVEIVEHKFLAHCGRPSGGWHLTIWDTNEYPMDYPTSSSR